MDRKYIEALESCRPNHDDIHAPEMESVARAIENDPNLKAFAESVQRFDTKLGKAIKAVDPPDDLRDRLIDAVREKAEAPSVDVDPSPKSSRRRWIVAGLGFAATAASLLIAFNSNSLFHRDSTNDLVGWVDELLPKLKSEAEWTTPTPEAVMLIPPDILQTASRHRQIGGADVFAFGKSKMKFLLFVKSGAAARTVPRVPPKPTAHTNGWRYGCWQTPERVYVVFVQGSNEDYLDLVKIARTPPMA